MQETGIPTDEALREALFATHARETAATARIRSQGLSFGGLGLEYRTTCFFFSTGNDIFPSWKRRIFEKFFCDMQGILIKIY